MGNIAGLSVYADIAPQDIARVISEILREELRQATARDDAPFWKTVDRARSRLCFHTREGELE